MAIIRDAAISPSSLRLSFDAKLSTTVGGDQVFSPRCEIRIDRWFTKGNAFPNRIVDSLLIDRGNYQSTPYFFLRIVRSGKTKKKKKKKKKKKRRRRKGANRQRSIKSFDANEIELQTHSFLCACVPVCSRNVVHLCAPRNSRTTRRAKDTSRPETGTKFTLADTFVATKSRRLLIRGTTPPIPNTFGRMVLTQEMRSSRVWFHCTVAPVHRSADKPRTKTWATAWRLATRPFKFRVRSVRRWYVVARVSGRRRASVGLRASVFCDRAFALVG